MIFFFKKNYHFICLYQKSLYLCKRENNKTVIMKATNIIINLAVLHIIRVVVLEPRGEEGSCM